MAVKEHPMLTRYYRDVILVHSCAGRFPALQLCNKDYLPITSSADAEPTARYVPSLMQIDSEKQGLLASRVLTLKRGQSSRLVRSK